MKLISKIKTAWRKFVNKIKEFVKRFKVTITIEYKDTTIGIGAKRNLDK